MNIVGAKPNLSDLPKHVIVKFTIQYTFLQIR